MYFRLLIKKLTPKAILEIFRLIQLRRYAKLNLNKYIHNFKEFQDYDFLRSQKYTNSYKSNDTPQKIIASIITVYHTIEKGLTMGKISLGFGINRMILLIGLCELYIKEYGTNDELLIEALGIISEYSLVHKEMGFKLESSLQKRIDDLLNNSQIKYTTQQLRYTKNNYFENVNSSFDLFSNSRHSLRDFNEQTQIKIENFEKAIVLSQNAPSTCNRQSVRLHLIANKELIREILSLQNGNRGFGNRADKLIIVTSDLQCWGGPNERFGPFLDAGIYTMNLLYSLHFSKIGAIALNWYSSIENDVKLRSLAFIPDNEVIAVIIACGGLHDNFKIAKSKRRHFTAVLKIHQ